MKILVSIEGQEPFKIEISRLYNYSAINDYGLKHPDYKYFQYDSDKPSYYSREAAPKIWFNGYLIKRKLKGAERSEIVDCRVKIIYDE